MRIDWNPNFLDDLMAAVGTGDLADRASRIAAACNGSSSWGGYRSAPGSNGQFARVWSADARDDESRDQRLLRFLDHGR